MDDRSTTGERATLDCMTTNAIPLASGLPQLTIARLRPGDTDTVHAVFAQLSLTSVWLRFQTGMPRLTDTMARRLAAVSPGQHEVLVAELDGQPVGLARWIRDPLDPDTVEVAVEVADAVQGQGIGGQLLSETMASARAEGARELVAYVHRENGTVITWLRRLGAPVPTCSDDPFRLSLTPGPMSVARGCMEPCGSGCSDPYGSRSTPGSRRPGALVRAICSPSSWRDAVARSRRRRCSTSSGATTPSG
ncbi:hypothetical protein JNB_08644 [Janibacter sp. HTCC2649]|nr:hypothetical protein JNB_08644 [Janibacter sp. HTCC2649]